MCMFLKSLANWDISLWKLSLDHLIPQFFELMNNSVFLIWCHENLVTANTMFSKADLASEGGKLSRAASALFPW